MEIILNIDFRALRQQKKSLIEVLNTSTDEIHKNDLMGILNLIDSIQDYAVDELMKDEKSIFGS